MTNPAESQTGPVQTFLEFWSQSLSLVLARIAGSPFPLEMGAADAQSPMTADDDVHLLITVSGRLRGELAVRIPRTSAQALAKIFTGEAENATELTDDSRSALEELFRQVAGYVVSSAKATLPELTLSVALAPAPIWPPAANRWIHSTPPAPQFAIELNVSAALGAALTAAPAVQETVIAPGSGPAKTVRADSALEFFMDLELDVTLRFGGRDILLKDVLELGPGSVLELDREIQDPADLLLDGKLVARGEVVLVNGNYGLRVTQVFTNSQSQA